MSSNQDIFFKNPALWLFYLYSPLTSCKKSEKSLKPFPRKQHCQPNNQPIISNNTELKTSLTPVQKRKIFKNCSNKTQLLRIFNKYVSTKSFFLDLILFCLGFFDSAECVLSYKVYSINNLSQFFHSCKTRNIDLAGKHQLATCN